MISLKQSISISIPRTKALAGIVYTVRNISISTVIKFFANHSPVTFAAATILLAGWKCEEVDPEIRQNSFETCWDQCLSILDHYKEQIHSAPRAIQVLRTLRSQVMAAQNQGQPSAPSTKIRTQPYSY